MNFYDTLAMLCNQIVQVSHHRMRMQQDKAKVNAVKRFKLQFLRATGKMIQGGDTGGVYNNMMMDQMYECQIDYDLLLSKIPALDGQIELIKQLRYRA